MIERLLTKYVPADQSYHGCEFFKVSVNTTGGLREEEYRYKWVKDKLFIDSKDDISLGFYDLWREIQGDINAEFKEWIDLRINAIESYDEGFRICVTGYRPCYQSEIDLYNKLQEQVSTVAEQQKKADQILIQEAQENYTKLLVRYQNKYKGEPI